MMATHKPGSAPDAQPGDEGFHALDQAHGRMLAVATALEKLVADIERDGIDADRRATAFAIADFYTTTVRQHHEDEERHVFPPLLRGGNERVMRAVLALQQDHGWLEEDWLELEPHLQALASGFGTCDFEILRPGSAVFVALLRAHIALEEEVIYPQARRRLDEAARHAMVREMAARRRAVRAATNPD
jgi:hemerythrin-like domain-containing protein